MVYTCKGGSGRGDGGKGGQFRKRLKVVVNSKNSATCEHICFTVISAGRMFVARCLTCWKRGRYAWTKDYAIRFFMERNFGA